MRNARPGPGCPLPSRETGQVLLAHGGGGRLTRELVQRVFLRAFDNPLLARDQDAAVMQPPPAARIAFTTDAYVVNPLFFPGGDLGSLAIHGTVNDLAMVGARARHLSVAFILEEGLPLETLERVVRSMATAARHCGVEVVTGDTKVVDAGKGDGIYVSVSGLGWIHHELAIEPQSISDGDVILVSGDVGRHGMAVMAVREGLGFETELKSDSAPVWGSVEALLGGGIRIHALRDVTRGGLAATLNELAEASGTRFLVEEDALPVEAAVEAACGMLGIDPWQVACEGRYLAVVPEADAVRALDVMRSVPCSGGACRIGRVESAARGGVILRGLLGVDRVLAMPEGLPLPRIC